MKQVAQGLWIVMLVAGCSRATEPAPTTPAAPGKPPTPVALTPPGPVAPTPPSPAKTVPPAKDQDKLKAELGKLGVGVGISEVRISAEALTDDGDFKPGIAERLPQLEPVYKVEAYDLPSFGAGAGKAVATIPGLQSIDLFRTKATDAGIAALGACTTIERLTLNNGSGEFPIVGDAGIAGLSKLENLNYLYSRNGMITGKGVAALAGLSKLEELHLDGNPIDNEAFPRLAKLASLQELNLKGSKVSGSAVEALKACTKLRMLDLNETGVDDAGVKGIAGLPKLSRLGLAKTAITNDGAAALANTKSLLSLDLFDTKVTDAGVIALAGLPKLRTILLFRLSLTDASLEALAKTPELSNLWIGGENKFTETGLKKFKAARPKVKIDE